MAMKHSPSILLFQLATWALSSGLWPSKGGSGWTASAQAAMAALSVKTSPVSSTIAGTVQGARVTCASGMFEFHAVDASHLLVAIDNVIWTLDRSPGALAAATTPAGVVQRLLEAHFAFDMGFDSLTVRHVRPFLTGGLAARIAAYFAAPPPRDVVPAIDGDPFTDAQEYPTRFSVQRATVTGARAAVVVRFADGYASRTMQYQLRSGPAGWRVDNIIYPGGGTFTGLLRMKAD